MSDLSNGIAGENKIMDPKHEPRIKSKWRRLLHFKCDYAPILIEIKDGVGNKGLRCRDCGMTLIQKGHDANGTALYYPFSDLLESGFTIHFIEEEEINNNDESIDAKQRKILEDFLQHPYLKIVTEKNETIIVVPSWIKIPSTIGKFIGTNHFFRLYIIPKENITKLEMIKHE